MVAASVGTPTTQKMDANLRDLIAKINRNTAAQWEQNEKWRLELGLPEREPTELVPVQGQEEESVPEPEEKELFRSPEPPTEVKG
ncbi:UNVERIFIED_CONTAM: hypothetical protein FKN15_010271 [Acipenser sinensis]